MYINILKFVRSHEILCYVTFPGTMWCFSSSPNTSAPQQFYTDIIQHLILWKITIHRNFYCYFVKQAIWPWVFFLFWLVYYISVISNSKKMNFEVSYRGLISNSALLFTILDSIVYFFVFQKINFLAKKCE